MSWQREERTERVTEWRRRDGMATVRIRERADGTFVVRLDRLEQASDGPAYERTVADDRADAETIAERFRDESSV